MVVRGLISHQALRKTQEHCKKYGDVEHVCTALIVILPPAFNHDYSKHCLCHSKIGRGGKGTAEMHSLNTPIFPFRGKLLLDPWSLKCEKSKYSPGIEIAQKYKNSTIIIIWEHFGFEFNCSFLELSKFRFRLFYSDCTVISQLGLLRRF